MIRTRKEKNRHKYRMLYPYRVNPTPSPDGVHRIPPGNLYIFEFSVPVGGSVPINVGQVSRTQDHSLRVWVSKTIKGSHPYGSPVWHANPYPSAEVFFAYDPTGAAPSPLSYPTGPGTWYAHVLNLTNAPAEFVFSDRI